MSPDQLLGALEDLVDAPNGIDKLRGLVFQLAVHGRLVAQDPGDETAEDLLDRIEKEKAALIASGCVPRPRALNDRPTTVQSPFELPPGWSCCILDDISAYIQRGKSPKYDDESPVRVVSQKCVQWSGFDLSRARGVQESSLDKYGPERLLVPGDLLWNSTGTGTVGRVGIFPETGVPQVVADSHVTVVRLVQVAPRFVWIWLAGPMVQATIDTLTTGSTKQQELNSSTVRLQPVPIPPLAEQHRIVARVDELMALLDRLEAAKGARDATRAQLRDAALAAFQDADDAEEVKTAWSRIADHMHDLFTDPADIQPLRQAVLELATRGRLTHQDAAEKPASTVVEQVAERQAELVLERAIPSPKPLPAVSPEEVPFDVPQGWRWVRIQEISTLVTDGVHKTPTYVEEGIPFLSIKDISGGKLNFSGTRYIPEHEHREINKRCNPTRGDILFCRIGTLGRAVVVDTDRPFSLFVSVGLLKISEHLDALYLCLALNSPSAYAQYERIKAGGSHTNKLNLGAMRSAIVPLPPREEQSRIVAEVERVTAVIDRLETALTNAQSSQKAFSASAVRALPTRGPDRSNR